MLKKKLMTEFLSFISLLGDFTDFLHILDAVFGAGFGSVEQMSRLSHTFYWLLTHFRRSLMLCHACETLRINRNRLCTEKKSRHHNRNSSLTWASWEILMNRGWRRRFVLQVDSPVCCSSGDPDCPFLPPAAEFLKTARTFLHTLGTKCAAVSLLFCYYAIQLE